jgi:dihydropteroate synthase
MASPDLTWQLTDRVLGLRERALVLGIVNVTPDSFSDGGRFQDPQAAIAHGLELVAEGADLLDIGGESSRPGAEPVSLDEELARVLPVVRGLVARTAVPLSIDTTKAEVARQALAAGAHIINDITALGGDPEMAAVVRTARAGIILMHMQGTPRTMQQNPQYQDVTAEVAGFLESRLRTARDLGIAEAQVVLDPGIGFGKNARHNLELLARLAELTRLGRPLCLGASRKRFLGDHLGRPPGRRLAGSLAAVCFAVAADAAQVVRVHDVAETRDVVLLFQALRLASRGSADPPTPEER